MDKRPEAPGPDALEAEQYNILPDGASSSLSKFLDKTELSMEVPGWLDWIKYIFNIYRHILGAVKRHVPLRA